jgi:hypothetical protein
VAYMQPLLELKARPKFCLVHVSCLFFLGCIGKIRNNTIAVASPKEAKVSSIAKVTVAGFGWNGSFSY